MIVNLYQKIKKTSMIIIIIQINNNNIIFLTILDRLYEFIIIIDLTKSYILLSLDDINFYLWFVYSSSTNNINHYISLTHPNIFYS